jgi:hypothetical protein
MIKDFKFFQEPTPIRWRTANGLSHRLENISIDHITSIVRCMNGNGDRTIPNPYEGRTHTEWIDIFHNEMIRRRDENI